MQCSDCGATVAERWWWCPDCGGRLQDGFGGRTAGPSSNRVDYPVEWTVDGARGEQPLVPRR
jgi:hypothetical protein